MLQTVQITFAAGSTAAAQIAEIENAHSIYEEGSFVVVVASGEVVYRFAIAHVVSIVSTPSFRSYIAA